MNTEISLYLDDQHSDSVGVDVLSIALIGPDEDRRKEVSGALAGCQSGDIREFFSYPASLDDVPKLLEQQHDVIIIDLDNQPEYALELVENICANSTATVMVYSLKTDPELLVRCMRAGAREFLTLPFAPDTMVEALARASGRRPAARGPKKAGGRLLVFLGAKGGDGVTTLACNFAVSVAQESSQSTLLIDLDLPLGDAALNLGVVAEYSAINALQNASRLDSSFLSKLLVRHSSGVSVLAAPGKFPQFPASNEAIDRLIAVARQDFENVVIDMGSRLDLMGTSLFKEGATVYLVIQAGIAGLRNSNRMISQYFATDIPKLEIVLNRFQSRSLGVAEDQITKALTRPAQWKIPNDYAAVRRMQHTAIPLALEDSPISRLIRQMARTACGLPATQEKGSGFSLKKISRSISAKISSSEEVPAVVPPVFAPEPENTAVVVDAAQPDETASAAEIFVDTPRANSAPASESLALMTLADAAESTGSTLAKAVPKGTGNTPSQLAVPETRTYKGATYVRGVDGQWHLQQTQTDEVKLETPVIAWSTPAPIAYGDALGTSQLNAMASVPGSFSYDPPTGDVLPVGETTLSVTFTPADTAAYTTAEAAVQLTVNQAAPAIAWPAPAAILVGAALNDTQLNAAASVPGTFVYSPSAGDVLPAGVHTLSATFTPADSVGYTEARAEATLAVTRATPAIVWPVPAPIPYGTALSAVQLNATASAPGTFTYSPSAGEVLPADVHTLSATFTPTDSVAYAEAKVAVSLTVNQATPMITWPAPDAIPEGATLSAAQLNATALVPGTFVYTPAAGEELTPGTHTLSAFFTPADAEGYAAVQSTVSLTVTRAPAEIVVPAPAAVSEGAPPASTQLNIEPQAALSEAAPADPVPVAPARPAPRKAKAPARPPVQDIQEAPAMAPEESSVEIPAETPARVQAQAEASDEAPVKADVRLPARAAHQRPARAHSKTPATPPIEPLAMATVTNPPVASVKTSVKASAAPPIETPATSPLEAQPNAIVRSGIPKPVIDVGPGLDLMGSAVFEDGTTIYLVMKPGSAGLPYSNRLVSQFFAAGGPKPDFVINRFDSHSPDDEEGQTSTALTKPARTPLSGMVARPAADLPATPEKKTGFSLKGLGRSIWSRISTTEKPPSITQLGLAADQEDAGAAPGRTQPDHAASFPGKSVYAPPASPSNAAGMKAPFTPSRAADRSEFAGLNPAVRNAAAPGNPGEPETRTYKGAVYVRGADGQWHLKGAEVKEVKKETPPFTWAMRSSTGLDAALRTSQLKAESHPVPARPVPDDVKESVSSTKSTLPKPASRKIPAKAPAKRQGKVASKPPAKTPPKRQAKGAAKPPAKSPAKRNVKAASKPPAKGQVKVLAKTPAKASAKRQATLAVKQQVKAASKLQAKTPAKRLIKLAPKSSAKAPAKRMATSPAKAAVNTPANRSSKSAAKPLAKASAHKSAPARNKPVPAPIPKPAKAVQPSQPWVQNPAPEPIVSFLSPGPAVVSPVAESAKAD